MEIKKYFDQLLDIPQMVNEKLPFNHWNSMVESSESNIPNWINTLFKLAALGLMLGAFWGGLNYLVATQQGDPVYDMEKPVMTQEWVPRERDSLRRTVEGTGIYIDVQVTDEDGNLQYYQKIDEETQMPVFEEDMKVFNTGDGLLGTIGYLLAKDLHCHFCDTWNPSDPNDNLDNVYNDIYPDCNKPLILVLEEFDIIIDKSKSKFINHKEYPIQVSDKN